MFCARCGKEMDNNSTFCPFCGQKVGEPVEHTKLNSKINSFGQKAIQRASVLQGFIHRKKLCGFILGLAAVAVAVSGAVRLAGGKKTVPEKLYEMSWKDMSEFSTDDFMDYLDRRDVRYVKKSRSLDFNVGSGTDVLLTAYNHRVYVKEFEPFFGGDCIVFYDTCSFQTGYVICYKTYEEFEKGMKALEKDIRKGCMLCKKYDFDDQTYHLTEMTKENIDICIENEIKHDYNWTITARNRNEYEEKIRNGYSDSDYSVCRIVKVGPIDIDDNFFYGYSDFSDNSLPDEVREIYSREMFAPYSYFCGINVYYDLEKRAG